jgi:hypothetical protein
MQTALIFFLCALAGIAIVIGTILIFVWILLNFEVE